MNLVIPFSSSAPKETKSCLIDRARQPFTTTPSLANVVTKEKELQLHSRGVNDPKLHPPPFVSAEHSLEVEHRERATVDDQNRTV